MQQVPLHENGVMGDCDSILKVGSSCTLGCKEGFEFVEKMKREAHKSTRIALAETQDCAQTDWFLRNRAHCTMPFRPVS